MATNSKYRELSLGPSEPITRRNSVQGMLVTADYIDPLSNRRMLLLKRVEAPTEEPAPKPKVTRKRKPKANAGHAEPATAFPGSAATNA